MASGHPLAAGLFLCLAVGGIGYGAVRAVHGQRDAHARESAERAARHKKLIVDGVARGQAGDFEGAVLALSTALREQPDDEDAAYNLGVALGALGRTEDAEKVLSALVSQHPEDWSAVAELAAVYDARGDGERAAQLLDRVPVGEGDLRARFADPERWSTVRGHARYPALSAKHGLSTTTTATASGP